MTDSDFHAFLGRVENLRLLVASQSDELKQLNIQFLKLQVDFNAQAKELLAVKKERDGLLRYRD